MGLQHNKNNKSESGFTIVELLIVIVVIGILAAITIVAFNGIQNRGKAASAQSAANAIVKKAEAYNSINSAYPTSTTQFNATTESVLTGSGTTLAAVADGTAPPAPATVDYQVCTTPTGNTGARVSYYNYAATSNQRTTINIGAACTAWASALTGTY